MAGPTVKDSILKQVSKKPEPVFRKPSFRKIGLSFYLSKDVVALAQQLLGKYIYTDIGNAITGGRIVETEAYAGIKDKASHSYGGKKTGRNRQMFEAGGTAYIYLCYGMHHLFNIVTGKKEDPQAVLIRAIEPVFGIKTMLQRRGKKNLDFSLSSGPGSLSRALGLHIRYNGIKMDSPSVWLEDFKEGESKSQKTPFADTLKKQIVSSARVGVAYAEEDALLPWRFRIKGNPWCSRAN